MNRDDLAIHQLKVQAQSPGEARRAAKTLGRYSPALGLDAWIFIRRLALSAASSALAQRAEEAALRLVPTAVDGWSAQASAADVVRFASRAEAMAALTADLSCDRAAQRWYWRRWSRLLARGPAALGDLLAEHIDILPAIVECLDARGQLVQVWAHLDSAAVAQVMAALNRHYQLNVGPAPRFQLLDASTLSLAQTVSSGPYWRRIRQRWQQPCDRAPATGGARQLAMLLVALEHFPVLLKQNAGSLLAALDFVLSQQAAEGLADGETLRKSAAVRREGGDSVLHGGHAEAGIDSSLPPVVASTTPAGRAEAPSLSTAPSAKDLKQSASGGHVSNNNSQSQMEREERPTHPALRHRFESLKMAAADGETAPNLATPSDAAPSFFSDYGGLFYLVNAINQGPIQTLLRGAPFWRQPGAGWRLLYRLGHQLGLSDLDPVVDFLALQMGYEQVGALIHLPPLAEEKALLQILKSRYSRDQVWSPGLIAVPGELASTASHLDVYLPMSAIVLPLRLSGLDINPGWVDWLGRVVSFHYRQGER